MTTTQEKGFSIEDLVASLQISNATETSAEEEFRVWKRHVAQQIEQLRRENIADGWQSFWMLRKAARTEQPDDVIAPLITWESGSANNYEALRYLITARDRREKLIRRFDIYGEPHILLSWAVAARHFPTVKKIVSNVHGLRQRKTLNIVAALLDPSDRVEFFATLGNRPVPTIASDNERLQILQHAGLLGTLNDVLAKDDADNDLARITVKHYDVRKPGIPRQTIAARAGTMESWLGPSPLTSTTYVEDIESLLAMRFVNMGFIAHGNWGAVIRAQTTDQQQWFALKFVALRTPSGEDDIEDVTNELRINLEFARLKGPALPIVAFPWLHDWTRARVNLRSFLDRMPNADYRGFRLGTDDQNGVGIYLLFQMELSYATMSELVFQIPLGARPAEIEQWHDILVRLYAQVLLQLVQIRRASPDFVHADLVPSNIFLWKSDSAVRVRMADDRVIVVPPHERSGLVASIGDFGQSKMRVAGTMIRDIDRTGGDVDALFVYMPLVANMGVLRDEYNAWMSSHRPPHAPDEILQMMTFMPSFARFVQTTPTKAGR